MRYVISILLISLFTGAVAANDDVCKFTLNLENNDNMFFSLSVKQLISAKTQRVKNQYISIKTEKTGSNQWKFSTLSLHHVIEIDFMSKSKSLLGGWTIGYKVNCIIQSIGNKIIGKNKEQMSLKVINTKGANGNVFNFKILNTQKNILAPESKS